MMGPGKSITLTHIFHGKATCAISKVLAFFSVSNNGDLSYPFLSFLFEPILVAHSAP
uniref:Uncharacterized protein n=1 Tax=Rhizophora mucronata TaxID=61149 RepID=A0A2P2QRI4_RHIMU